MSSLSPHEGSRINGEKILTGNIRLITNPYSGIVISEVSFSSRNDVRRAIESSYSYAPKLSRYARSSILQCAANLLRQRRNEASDIITSESGLSKKDTTHEVLRVIDVLEFGSRESLKDDGQEFSCDLTDLGRNRKGFTVREPLLGVIGAITPFNHPMNQVAHKVVPSIATNNRMVLKPSEKAPLSALYFADLMYEAGLPVEMFQVIVGSPDDIADEFLKNEMIELIAFTGSVRIGKQIAKNAGYRKLLLELGGNDPFIIMEDADIEKAADLAATGSYSNTGQRCTSIKRILVQEKLVNKFTELMVEKTNRWTFGDPTSETNHMGTLISIDAAMRVEKSVIEAVQQGARVLTGHVRDNSLYAPTVLDRVIPSMSVVMEETFGPVSPIMSFKDIGEAIHLANATKFGLSSGVCTNRMDYITKFVNELNVGTVNIWEVPGYRMELTPFGGIKDSGLGQKEGIQEAMKFFTHAKLFTIPWSF